jgi:hypothetical protein
MYVIKIYYKNKKELRDILKLIERVGKRAAWLLAGTQARVEYFTEPDPDVAHPPADKDQAVEPPAERQ